MTIQGELVYGVAVRLGIVLEGTATGGGAGGTSVIDTKATSTKEFGNKVDDFYNGGSVGIFNPTGGIVAWEYSEVSDSKQATQTLYVQNTLSTTVVAGDRYWVSKKNTPAALMTQKINQILGEWQSRVEDITSITTTGSQREYTLPQAASLDLRQVYIQRHEGDTDDNQWDELYDWYIQGTGIGSADKLVFRQQLPTGKLLKLVYFVEHPMLYGYSDKLDDTIHKDLIIIPAAMRILEDKLEIDPRPELQNRWNLLADARDRVYAKWDHRERNTPALAPKLNTIFGRRSMRRRYPGDPDAVRRR